MTLAYIGLPATNASNTQDPIPAARIARLLALTSTLLKKSPPHGRGSVSKRSYRAARVSKRLLMLRRRLGCLIHHAAVKEPDRTVRELGVPRIVSHHADSRSG